MFYYACVVGTIESVHQIESGKRYNVEVEGFVSSSGSITVKPVIMFRVSSKVGDDLEVGDKVKVYVGDTSFENKSYNGTKHIFEVLERVSKDKGNK